MSSYSSTTSNTQTPPKLKDIIGIKFGSRTTVLGTVNNHAVDTLNISNRFIQSMASYTPNLRQYDESAQISYLKNIPSTFINLNRLIGLKYEDEKFVEHEKKFMLFDYEFNKEKEDFLYDCKYNKNKNNKKLPIENIIAGFFVYLNKTWSNSNNQKDVNGVVISIPDYYSLYQRKILIDILKISGINCISLLHESTSICLSYFLHHYKDLPTSKDKSKIICFIDLGQCKLSLHLCSFSHQNPKILFSKSNKFVGCRDFDFKIYQHLEQKFPDEMKIVNKNKKLRVKLLQTIEKSRKMITVNKESIISFDVGDLYINFDLSRDVFKSIIKEEIEEIKIFIKQFFDESKVDMKLIDSIEMVGDMIRNPIFEEILKEMMQKNINKTLVADECIAQGCAFYSALIDEQYSPICNFGLTQFIQFDIEFFIKGKDLGVWKELIKRGDNFPIKKGYKFRNEFIKNEDEIIIGFFVSQGNSINNCDDSNNKEEKKEQEKEKKEENKEYKKENEKGLPISEFSIKIGNLMKRNTKNQNLFIELLVDSNSLPSVSECYFTDTEGYLADKIEIFKTKDFPLSNFTLSELIKTEIDMEFIDYDTVIKNNRKNEIEGILYKLRDEKILDEKFDLNEKIENILNINDIELLDKEYKEIKEKYKLVDKLKDEHEKNTKIYTKIRELKEKDNKREITEEEFVDKGRKICRLIDKGNNVKIEEINKILD